ncbi:MAG: hypothetical protein RUDDFDWM_001847 [Candidatus Fervidibacterota bacterium]
MGEEAKGEGWIKVHICFDQKKGKMVEFSLTDEGFTTARYSRV